MRATAGKCRGRGMWAGLAVLLGGLAVGGCSNEVTPPRDEVVPSRVTNLAVSDVDDSTVTLTWTAPGDDGSAGTVAGYEIRWLSSPFNEPNWEAGTTVGPSPAPLASGSTQTARVRDVPAGATRYIALRAQDEEGNRSLVSNHVTAQTGAPICRVSADTLDFGAAAPGFPFDRLLRLENLGGGTLRGEIPGGCGPFTVVSGGGTVALRAGGTQTCILRFLPPAVGTYECLFQPGTACAQVVLRGEGVVSETAYVPFSFGEGVTYRMGSPRGEAGRDSADERSHDVRLTRAFRLADREVTQAEWYRVMGWNESAHEGAQLPVENITWFDALAFCNELSIQQGLQAVYDLGDVSRQGNHIVSALVVWSASRSGYRLPTEAEWEYACRAGGEGAFFAGAISELTCSPLDPVLAPIAWYCGNAGSGPRETRTAGPNAFGLYDTHGNVFEWCWDYYESEYGLDFPDPPGEPPVVTNPYGPEEGSSRICRGGSWSANPPECRSAFRFYHPPGNRYPDVGLRLVAPA